MEPGGIERLVAELSDQLRRRFYGKYRGLVQDTDDPQGMGRIRATVPEVLDAEPSPWALPCVPYAGDGEGFHMIPPVGAAVWIEFEAGDPSRPVWTGGWWGSGQVPTDTGGTAATPERKITKSHSGCMFSISDENQLIEVSDKDGSNLLEIAVKEGKVTVKATTKVIVEAPQIELVESATHPVVFGDELMTYLNQLVTILQTHTHPGELAAGFIPVTPMVPGTVFPTPTPSLISTKVKAG